MATTEQINTFEILNRINLSDKLKRKMDLNYLSWAEAWNELKKAFPNSSYTVYKRNVKTTTTVKRHDDILNADIETVSETENEIPYFTDGNSCYVQVGVTVEGVEYVENYPIMDNRNNAILAGNVTMTNVNKSIQRAFVKACARHGLGLYVYSGEDLPEAERVVIDFKSIVNACDVLVPGILTDEQFEIKKQQIIQELTQLNYPQDVQDKISSMIQEINQGKRISAFTNQEDSVKVQKIALIFDMVKSAYESRK